MARSIWSGTLTFGLVAAPVKLYPASSEKSVRFHQINPKTGNRVVQKRVDAASGGEVAYEDLVKGFEYTPDRYVVVEPGELDALAPEKTKAIEITEFVDEDQLNPLAFGSAYYVAPDTGGTKAYTLLTRAMQDTGKVAIGRVVLRSKEKLVALEALSDGTIACRTMLFADEVNDTQELKVELTEVSEAELKVATQLVDAISGDFDYASYHDTYREAVLDMIERKAAGEEWTAPETAKPRKESGDILAALEASLETVRGSKAAVPAKPASRRPAKKPAKTAV